MVTRLIRILTPFAMVLLLSGCFNAETTLTFHADETVTSKGAVILEKEIVALSEIDPEQPAFCSAANEIREDHPKGVSCAMRETLLLTNLLAGPQLISFGGQMMEDGQEEPDLTYYVTKQNDGTILVSFDLRDLKEAADQQATGGEVVNDEERQQIIALVKALFADSGFAVRVTAPKIISTNGTMIDETTAEFGFAISDMFEELAVPNSFDVVLSLR